MRDHDFAPGTVGELDLCTGQPALAGDRENLPVAEPGVYDPRSGFEPKLLLRVREIVAERALCLSLGSPFASPVPVE